MKKNKKDKRIGTFILVIVTIIFVAMGVLCLISDFKKMNRAAGYSEKILDLYVNSEEK